MLESLVVEVQFRVQRKFRFQVYPSSKVWQQKIHHFFNVAREIFLFNFYVFGQFKINFVESLFVKKKIVNSSQNEKFPQNN